MTTEESQMQGPCSAKSFAIFQKEAGRSYGP